MTKTLIDPVTLSEILGQKFAPTDQQSDIIGADPGPLLVVAGAGAGKTETMAARVVWLVANGYARPEEVIGLTFTRKASQELGTRIRQRLQVLRDSPRLDEIDGDGQLRRNLETIAPYVPTYDSFAGDLVREFGLLLPVEPTATIIQGAHLVSIAQKVVRNYQGKLATSLAESTVVDKVMALFEKLDSQLFSVEGLYECARAFDDVENMPKPEKGRGGSFTKDMQKWVETQQLRLELLPLVEELRAELRRRNVATHGQIMAAAARIARDHPSVGHALRRRFSVVMLDEYQDTSHAQRVLLRSLFGQRPHDNLTVTAVGDPMQAIYEWRGATIDNLQMFNEDFPQAVVGASEDEQQPAATKELTTSWRNPSTVLSLANRVADDILGSGPDRPVTALQARSGAGAGSVALGYWADVDEELAWVADRLAAKYQQFCREREENESARFSAAVLVRKNRQSHHVAQALEERGVPCEIIGLGGLLDVPEVADMMAVATMLVRPADFPSALRILAGPAVGLGLYDLKALAARAHNLAGRMRHTDAPDDASDDASDDVSDDAPDEVPVVFEPGSAEQHLVEQLSEAGAAYTDHVVGLTDAVADLGETDHYSEEGLARINDVAAKLRYLRTYCLSKPLSDLFADIVEVFGLRTEVLSHHVHGAVHIDRILEEIAAFDTESLEAWLDYASLAREHDKGLAPSEIVSTNDCVQIMTGHKAKGLEFSTVCVIHCDSSSYKATAETFLTKSEVIPEDNWTELFEVDDRKEFNDQCKALLKEDRSNKKQEQARVFYVALTRAEDELIVTGSDKDAYEQFEALHQWADKHTDIAGLEIANWTLPDKDADTAAGDQTDVEEDGETTAATIFPALSPESQHVAGAELVRQSLAPGQEPDAVDGELFSLWERETTALIEEHRALSTPVVEVEIPGELTASELVALRDNPEQFARRQRRPVPFKPNAYAKRGTAFHEWIEKRYGSSAIIEETELPGHDSSGNEDFNQLKEAFLASHWAEKTPVSVEQGFEFSLGNSVVRGRMDAVFDVGDSFIVVDWKTGRPPKGEAMSAAIVQLAVYREAWQKISGTSKPVRAAFHYIADGYTFEPDHLPDAAKLEELLGHYQ